jgi:hypothetical protein
MAAPHRFCDNRVYPVCRTASPLMNYFVEAKQAVERLHHCTAVHVETVRVRHADATTVIWDGDVEVFALEGFRGADCCYVWGFDNEREGGKLEFISVPAARNTTTPLAAVVAVVDWEKNHSRRPIPVPSGRIRGMVEAVAGVGKV